MPDNASFRVLIAGGGPAAVEAALTFHEVAPDLDVTLLSPEDSMRYRPLSTIAPFAHGEVRAYPLGHLEPLGIRLYHDGLLRADVPGQTVRTERGDDLPYDALLIATGALHRRAVPRVMTFEGPGYVQ